MTQLRGGIDNGFTGAIVAFNERYQAVLGEPMPVLKASKSGRKRLDMVRLDAIFYRLRRAYDDVFFVLEHAQAMPKQGASSGFNYGTTYGAIQMALIAHKIPFEIVTPRKWQASVGISSGGTKDQAILICQRRLPSLDLTPGKKRKPDIGLADAGGMALHAVSLRPFLAQTDADVLREKQGDIVAALAPPPPPVVLPKR